MAVYVYSQPLYRYLRGDDGNALAFATRKGAEAFLKAHNYPLDDVIFEEEE
jgi:hypothetical protein